MGKKILIVDDAEVNRAILLQIFEEEYEVLQAKDGETALSVMTANAHELALVLLDLKMPVVDGFSVLSNVKKNPLLHTIPIVVATDCMNNENEMQALELGAADFITKPYNVAIIRQRVRNIIDMQESLSYKKISERDRLTGIYNREHFYVKTGELLNQKPLQKYVIFCLNIDKFKVINDLFGTCEGDKLLIYVAQELASRFGTGAVYGRLGADNFAVCMEQQAVDGIEAKITEYLNAVMEKYPLDIRIVVRCGFYKIHDSGVPIEIMCDRANMAIMEIKGSYSKRYSIYDDKIRDKMLQEQEIINEMKQALDEQQFSVYYQPKYNMETRKVIGAEALVRWIHPTKGIISPGVFIPVFEKNGFISALDMYVWEKTCQDIRDWMKKGYALCPVSVNVSRAELYNTNLCMMVQNLIQKYAIPMKLLQLEITESAYTENPEQLIESVNKLKAAGFVILMDDFGSGYSSLNTLKDVPVDVLKLDLKFLYNMDENIKANYILKSVVQMAKRLELTVIAEGVETEQQADFLLSIGCIRGQGYLYAKPMPRTQYEELISDTVSVSTDDEDEVEGIVNIDDVMSKLHREDEVAWYRAAVIQMHVMLVQYEVANDVLTLFDLRSKESSKELSKMEIPNFLKVVQKGKYIYPADVERMLQMLQSRKNQIVQIRARHYRRNNGYIWCEVSGRWIYDEKNKPIVLNCVIRDLTEQKLNEAMLSLLNAFEQETDEETIFRRVMPEIACSYILGGISLFVNAKHEKSRMNGFRWSREHGFHLLQEKIPLTQEELLYLKEHMDENNVVSFRKDTTELSKKMRDIIFQNGAKTVVIASISLDDDYKGFIFYYNMDTECKYTAKEMLAFSEISKCLSENMKRMTAERRKRESLELYEISFQKSALRIWEYDLRSKMLVSSKSAQTEIGYGTYTPNVPESLIEAGMVHEDYIENYRNVYRQVREGKDGVALFKGMHPDGAYKWVRVDYSVIRNDGGIPIKAVGFGEDVNTIYESQSRIRKDIKYRNKITQDSKAMFEIDLTDNRYLKIVHETRKMFQQNCFSDSMRQYAKECVLPEYQEEFLHRFGLKNLLHAYRQGKQYISYIFPQKNEDGRIFWVEAVAYLGYDEDSHHIHCFLYVRNIQEVMDWVQEAGCTMTVDSLTNVMAKQEFEHLAKYLLAKGSADNKSVLLIVDMDEFTSINQFFGEEYGDEVLANAASIIKATTPLHSIIGRIGGDRFCIYIHEYISRKEVSKMVQNLVRHLFASFLSGRTIHQITASVGISYAEEVGRDYDRLLDGADEFLNHLKHKEMK